MSSFRPIQPSVLSVPVSSEGQDGGPMDPIGIRARRRKAPSHVSQNACTNCKKARAKCDGEEPEVCSRCIQRQISDGCHYEVHSKTAKEELIKRIKVLEARNSDRDRWAHHVLQILQNEAHGEITEQLKQTHEGQTFLEALHRAPPDYQKLGSDSLSDNHRRSSESNMANASEEAISPRWMAVVSDEAIAHHLLGLYFSWVHPVHMLFSEQHFMRSFRSGDSTYCNDAMLNAMCALGCFYSIDQETGEPDAQAMAEKFYRDGRIRVEQEDPTQATTCIAYAILFLVECSKGNGRRGDAHLRLAVESLRHVDRSQWDGNALEICMWGLHTLNTVWASFTYQKPPDPKLPRSIVFNGIESDSSTAYWMFYRVPGDQALARKPSAPIETAKAFASLNQIVVETLNVFCGRRGRVTARGVLSLYTQYLHWQETLPRSSTRPVFEETEDDDGQEVLPHVLYLHCHYFAALVQLFAPLLVVQPMPALTREHIKTLSLQHAREGLRLLDLYHRRYSGRYQTPLHPFSAVHLAEAVLVNGSTLDADRVIVFMLEFLAEARPIFPVAGVVAAMFCESVVRKKLKLPPHYEAYLGGRTWKSFSNEEKLDCCDRLTYTQPVDMLKERLDASLVDNFAEEWKVFIEVHGSNTTLPEDLANEDINRGDGAPGSAGSHTDRSMDVSSIMNP